MMSLIEKRRSREMARRCFMQLDLTGCAPLSYGYVVRRVQERRVVLRG